MRKTACIVIPIYKNAVDSYELISLKQCSIVLRDYDVCFIRPQSLQLYPQITGLFNSYFEEPFPDDFFVSTKSYNSLMVSTFFYKKFRAYKYILIYQTDAFVFRDEIKYWCDRNFDYIGAPWIDMKWAYNLSLNGTKSRQIRNLFYRPKRVNIVGNGGFSLRKVRTFIFLSFLLKRKITSLTGDFNEDIFWGLIVKGYYPFFKIPPNEEALRFSFELFPEKCFDLNEHNLPFGCHAWNRYNAPFWKKYIDF